MSGLRAVYRQSLRDYENSAQGLDGFRHALVVLTNYTKLLNHNFAILERGTSERRILAELQEVAFMSEIAEMTAEMMGMHGRFNAMHNKLVVMMKRRPGRVCPMCTEQFKDPEATPCGHVFCGECLARWLTDKETCPTCRSNVKHDNEKEISDEVAEAMSRSQEVSEGRSAQ